MRPEVASGDPIRPDRRPPRLASAACWLLIAIFALFLASLAVQQHRTFQTNGLDLGNVDQALWNTAQGRFLHFTLMAPIESRLALHVEPILFLWLPLYWLGLGGPEALLVGQALVVAVGAWPLYQLTLNKYSLATSRMAGSPMPGWVDWLGLLFPLAYLLLPTLEAAVLYDFHAVTLAPTFLLFAFWSIETGRARRFLLFALLTMACKEDMPLVVAMLGLYLGLARRRWGLAGLTIGLSLAWFGTAVGLIQPRFGPGGNIQLDRYVWLGSNPLEMVQTVITQPGLVFDHLWNRVGLPAYLLSLFFPTAFLALLSPLTLLPMLPTLAINLLSNNPFTWRLEDFHYGAPLAPFLFISALYGTIWLSQNLRRWIGSLPGQKQASRAFLPRPANLPLLLLTLLLFSFSVVYHYYRGFTPLARPFDWPIVTPHHRQLAALLPGIPAEAALFTQSNLAPHLAHRAILYSDFGYFTDPAFRAAPVDDILLDVTTLENHGGLHQFLARTLLASGDYRPVTARNGILHLRPVAAEDADFPASVESSALPPDFYTFVRPDPPPDYQATVEFGNLMRLHGYSLHFERQEEVQVSVDLALIRSLEPTETAWPVLYLLDANGQPQGGTEDLQPALVWFPPRQWPAGETVRVRFNTLPWPGYTRQAAAYRLALGVVNGGDIWQSPRYQPAVSQPGPYALRLPAGGSLVELARIEPVWGMPEGGPSPRLFTAPEPPHPLEANFDNQIKLLGHTPPRFQPEPAGSKPIPSLAITLTWQALGRPEPLVRFVQLIGPDGLIYGQDDSIPDRGQYPTQLWQPGEMVVETVTLPLQPARPAGDYRLHLGLYRPDSSERLPLLTGGDHVEIPLGSR